MRNTPDLNKLSAKGQEAPKLDQIKQLLQSAPRNMRWTLAAVLLGAGSTACSKAPEAVKPDATVDFVMGVYPSDATETVPVPEICLQKTGAQPSEQFCEDTLTNGDRVRFEFGEGFVGGEYRVDCKTPIETGWIAACDPEVIHLAVTGQQEFGVSVVLSPTAAIEQARVEANERLDEVNEQLADAEERLNDIQDRLGELAAQEQEALDRLEALQNSEDATQDQIEAAQQTLDEIQAEQDSAQNQLDNIEHEILLISYATNGRTGFIVTNPDGTPIEGAAATLHSAEPVTRYSDATGYVYFDELPLNEDLHFTFAATDHAGYNGLPKQVLHDGGLSTQNISLTPLSDAELEWSSGFLVLDQGAQNISCFKIEDESGAEVTGATYGSSDTSVVTISTDGSMLFGVSQGTAEVFANVPGYSDPVSVPVLVRDNNVPTSCQ